MNHNTSPLDDTNQCAHEPDSHDANTSPIDTQSPIAVDDDDGTSATIDCLDPALIVEPERDQSDPSRYDKAAPFFERLGNATVPIIIGDKRPATNKWTSPTSATLEDWKEECADCFTGILTGRSFPLDNPNAPVGIALDVDIGIPEASAEIDLAWRVRFGNGSTRIGRWPRWLRQFRASPGIDYAKGIAIFVRIDTETGEIEVGEDGKTLEENIELLARGQQFVASGIHPKTMVRYSWFAGDGSGNKAKPTPLADTPEIAPDEIVAFILDDVVPIMECHGWTLLSNTVGQTADHRIDGRAQGDGGEWISAYSIQTDSEEDVRRYLSAQDAAADQTRVFANLAALYDWDNGPIGYKVALEWLETSPKHKDEAAKYLDEQWRHLDNKRQGGRDKVARRTIGHLRNDYQKAQANTGYPDSRKIQQPLKLLLEGAETIEELRSEVASAVRDEIAVAGNTLTDEDREALAQAGNTRAKALGEVSNITAWRELLTPPISDGKAPSGDKLVQLKNLILERGELYRDTGGRARVYFTDPSEAGLDAPVMSSEFEEAVIRRLEQEGRSINAATMSVIQAKLGALAPPERTKVHMRYCRNQNGHIIVDPGWFDTRRIEIDETNGTWQLLDSSEVRFERTDDMGMLPVVDANTPRLSPKAYIKKLFEQHMKGIPVAARTLVLAWLIDSMRSGRDFGILLLWGPHGSRKTSAMVILEAMLDPPYGSIAVSVKDADTYAITVAARHLSVVDEMPLVQSEKFVAIVNAVSTGGTAARRALRTTSTVRKLELASPQIMAANKHVLPNPSTRSRSIAIHCPTVEEINSTKIGDLETKEYEDAFKRDSEVLYASHLSLTAKVLQRRRSVEVHTSFRLKRLARIGVALHEILEDERDFVQLLEQNAKDGGADALGVVPAVAALADIADARGPDNPLIAPPGRLLAAAKEWQEKVTKRRLSNVELAAGWPSIARLFTDQIRESEEDLAARGVTCRPHRRRNWILEREAPRDDDSLASELGTEPTAGEYRSWFDNEEVMFIDPDPEDKTVNPDVRH